MDDHNSSIVQLVTKGLTGIACEYNLSKPKIVTSRFMTTIAICSNDLGVEIEIDWIETDVFVLLVALVDGRYPAGYYVSEGKKCRVHLEKFLSKCCKVGNLKVNEIHYSLNRRKDNDNRIEAKINYYLDILQKHIPDILKYSSMIFEG